MAKNEKRRNPVILRQGMSIGTGNAESDDEFLFDCFVDYPAVDQCRRMESAGRILAGRTGAGKTAIIRYLEREAEHAVEVDPAQMSMSYVSNSDALRFLTAIGADLDLLFQVLWKHVLCIEFVRLRWRVENEAKSKTVFSRLIERFSRDERKRRAIQYLRDWEGKFWITTDQNIKEITEKVEDRLQAEFAAEIKAFKAGAGYASSLSTERKSELVARSRSIINADQLSELHGVIEILADNSADDPMQRFYILIDRLDENWVDDSIRFKLIRALIASLKSFSRIRNLKIVVALRADILERVVQETSDVTFQREKFEDYNVKLKWSKTDLRQLLEKRLNQMLKRQYTGDDISFEDIFTAQVGQKDPFDYIIERTMMRPRDVIAFVNECISASDGQIEVSATHVRRAEIEFARKRRDALLQEWKSAFPSLDLMLGFATSKRSTSTSLAELSLGEALDDLALGICSRESSAKDPAFKAAQDYCETSGANKMALLRCTIPILYRTGAVGLKFHAGDRFQYSHLDDPLISPEILEMDTRIRLHPMLHAAFRLTDAEHDGGRAAKLQRS